MRRYSTYAERAAAYREHDEQAELKLYLPALMPLSAAPPVGRWRLAVDLAARLLQAVAEETQDYVDARTEAWTTGKAAEQLNENIDAITDMLAQIDDLRRQF
jgi:hypothetical protein